MNNKLHLERAKKIASILDTRFNIAGIKFGLDPLLSIIPGLGSVIGAMTSTYVFWIASKLKVSTWTYIRMGINIIVDLILGEIPIVGAFIDVFYRSNLKNIKLLERHIKSKVVNAEIL